jgi:aspartate racemase
MKTVGIIGGIGPESTIEYYRQIIAAYRARQNHPSSPSVIINSIDINKLLAWMRADDLGSVVDYLLDEIQRLARAGADFGALAANTPHIVFDQLRRRSPIPLLSIVEAVCDEARTRKLKRVALFGTRFTMQARFYSDVFSKMGITIALPQEDEQVYIHEIYINELLNNVFRPETRDRLTDIVDRMKARDNIEAVILGGTELPLLLRDPQHNGIPFLDTTRIHVNRIVAELVA